jgi:alanine racemase
MTKGNRGSFPFLPSLKTPIHHSEYDPWIELDLNNLASNLEKVKKLAKTPVMAVIKANAYGHGLTEVGLFLDKQGIDFLMVCKLTEALKLREAGVRCPILNFGPFDPGVAESLIKEDISQSIFTENVKDLAQSAQRLKTQAKIHIHIDTGMGRMGIPYHKAFPFLKKTASMKGIQIKGISTTLTEDSEFDPEQLKRFLSLYRQARESGLSLGLRHAASSAALFSHSPSFMDMVRPGIVLYGYYPSDKTQDNNMLSLKPILQIKSRVAAVKSLRPRDSVGYHRIYKAKKREKIAVIPIGYSDGYPFANAGKGYVLINGKRRPIIADITANHTEVLLPVSSQISLGEEVVLIGSQGGEMITAHEVGKWTDISTYKILLSLNPLIPKKLKKYGK